MKLRNCLLILSILLVTSTTKAQSILEILNLIKPEKAYVGTPVLAKKSNVLSIGFGYPNNVTSLLSFTGSSSILSWLGLGATLKEGKSGVGPFNINYDYFLKNNFSLGLNLLYAKGEKTYNFSGIFGSGNSSFSGKINLFQVGITSVYHLYTTNKLDPYVKGMIGINFWKGSYTDNSDGSQAQPFEAPTPVAYQGILGLRYFVAKKTCIYGELGYTSLKFSANIGVGYKLNKLIK